MASDLTAGVDHPWLPIGDPSPARAARHQLADAVRGIVARVALVDVAAAPGPELDEAVRARDDLLQRIGRLPALGSGAARAEDERDRRLVERGPISGRGNPLAAPLEMSTEPGSGVVRATAVFGTAYEGPSGMVHGGVLLAAFDEVLAFGQVPSGAIGMTGTVTVKLLAPVPIGRPVEFEAGTSAVDGRKTTVWARAVLADGTVAAEASAICIRLRPA